MTAITDQDLEVLLKNLESDRVERKESIGDGEKIRRCICAFANDIPNHREPGVIFIGCKNDGSSANLLITDELLLSCANMRTDGSILPLPSLTIQIKRLCGTDLIVIIVQPSDAPPVRYKGIVWIRIGPSTSRASSQEEKQLAEKRRSGDLPFDMHPITSASSDDLDIELFRRVYLLSAVSPEVLDENDRTIEQQLTALRFMSYDSPGHPTVTGLLAVGKMPTDYIPGAYIQFLRLDGRELTSPIINEHEIHGPLIDVLRRMDELLELHIQTTVDITSGAIEIRHPDYPLAALRQLTLNAVMHRNYETSNAPIRINWFSDRIEIQNPGGPFGQVTREKFGTAGLTDYRNPHVAEVMKNLGYVQRFGAGIPTARRELQKNGNPPPEFITETDYIQVVIRSRS